MDFMSESSTASIIEPADLRTGRLHLRRFRPSDAALVELYGSDERVARMTERIPHPYPPGLAESYVSRAAARSAGEVTWAIDIAGSGDAGNYGGTGGGLIGVITLRREPSGIARLGYWVAPAFWNAGYASEAAAAVVAHAATLGIPEITARVFHENVASVQVLMHAGFDYTGDGEAYSVAQGRMVPTHNYRRLLAAQVAR